MPLKQRSQTKTKNIRDVSYSLCRRKYMFGFYIATPCRIPFPPLAIIYWPIRLRYAYTDRLCLPSWRHQQMYGSYKFWKHYLSKKYQPDLCIQKRFYTPLFLISLSDYQKKTLLPVPTQLAHSNYFFSFFFHPSLIFLWSTSYAFFLSYKTGCQGRFSEEKWPKKMVIFLRILLCFFF